MNEKEGGAPLANGTPEAGTHCNTLNKLNCNANVSVRKQPDGTQGKRNSAQTRQQLAEYLGHGWVPIPLNGKQPLVKWTKWNPRTIGNLESFIRRGCDWGIKTGNGLVVLDFDSVSLYESFMALNRDKLPADTPIDQTGRPGYHVFGRTTKPVKNQHFEGLDVKSDGGYVVVPPSIHKSGAQYHFLRPLPKEIPIIDFDSLVLPCVKPDYETRPKAPFNPSDWKPVTGNMVDLINNGAEEGQRHNVLVSYLGALISRGLSKELVSETAVLWNEEKNRPPLPNGEVLSTIESCWASYKPRVPIKTLASEYSVLNGTGPEKRKSPEERKKIAADLMAKEKAAELPHNEMCGKRHAITRQSRRYLTVVFFCGAWSCPRCADFFRRRWLDHLQTATAGSNLYILKSLESDWGRLRRSLNRLGAEYIKVITGSEITIILNKEVTGSSPILQDKLSELLDTLLPHKTQTCPISTSRGWQRAKKLDNNPDEVEKPVLVTHTWLPIDVQQYVAKKLGATLDGDQRWVSPEDQDAQGWENEFTKQLMILEQDLWSQIKQKGQSIEAWLNDFQRDMEADDVFDRGRERWEVMAG